MAIIRWLLVTVSVVILSTLGINAFDNINTPNRSLLGAAFSSIAAPCPDEMVYVPISGKSFCIDRYEASVGEKCPNANPQSKRETDDNLLLQTCEPVSVKGATPWRYISRQQAELACSRSGKRLPTNNEWYRAALGTPDKNASWGEDDCNVSSLNEDLPSRTGSRSLCVSSAGAYDMIGNVWEWLEETVEDGEYVDFLLPYQGYIASIDEEGIPLETSPDTPEPSFFEDYFWINESNVRGMLRGGYWKSKSDAGQYALNVTVPPSFIGDAVGFRCVQDAN